MSAELDQLAVAIEAGEPIPEPARTWFLQAAAEWRDGRARLDDALMLERDMVARDEHLLRAAACLPADLAKSARAKELAQRIDQFMANHWPRLRFAPAPPADIDDLDAELFHAAKAGALPKSWRHLERLDTNREMSNAENVRSPM